MNFALALAPYFTNGDYPSLGLGYVNSLMKKGQKETRVFDFCFKTYKENPEEYHIYRQVFGLHWVKDEVLFVLEPKLFFYFLYYENFPDFKWEIEGEPLFKQAVGMCYLGIRELSRGFAENILSFNPDAVFFSTYLTNLLPSLMIAKELKRLKKELLVITGGPGVGLVEVAELVLRTGFVDGVLFGEAEGVIEELCKDFPLSIYSELGGNAFLKDGNFNLSKREKFLDLADLTIPDFSGFPLPGLDIKEYSSNRPNKYSGTVFDGFPVSMSRGCRNRCAFCSESAYWKRFRFREVDDVINEIEKQASDYGIRQFLFCDSAIDGSIEWLKKFVERMEGKNYKFNGQMIADSGIDLDFAKAMKRAGFSNVSLGIETFSTKLRKMINKKGNAKELINSVLSLARAGLNVDLNVLVGFPKETESDIEDSINCLRQIRESLKNYHNAGWVHFNAGHPLRLEPYSLLYNHPENYGIVIEPYEISLPEPLEEKLGQALRNILFRWKRDPDWEEVQKRSRRLKEIGGFKPI